MKSVVIFTTFLIIIACIHGVVSSRKNTKIISDELCGGENPDNILCGIARNESENASNKSKAEDEHTIDQDDESNAELEIKGEENISDVDNIDTIPIEKNHQKPRASDSRSGSGTYPRQRRKLQKLHAKSYLPQHPRPLKEYTARKFNKDENNKTDTDNSNDEFRSNEDSKPHKDYVSNKKNEYNASDSLRQRRRNSDRSQDAQKKKLKFHSIFNKKGEDSKGLGKYFVYVNCNSCKVSSHLIVGGKDENNTNRDNATIFRRSLDDRKDGEDNSYQGDMFNSDYDQRIKKYLNHTILNLPIVGKKFVTELFKTLIAKFKTNDGLTNSLDPPSFINVDGNVISNQSLYSYSKS